MATLTIASDNEALISQLYGHAFESVYNLQLKHEHFEGDGMIRIEDNTGDHSVPFGIMIEVMDDGQQVA